MASCSRLHCLVIPQKRIEHKKKQTKYRKMATKPRSYVRILTYRTRAIIPEKPWGEWIIIYLQFAINKCLKMKPQNCRCCFPTNCVHRHGGNFVIIFFKILFFLPCFRLRITTLWCLGFPQYRPTTTLMRMWDFFPVILFYLLIGTKSSSREGEVVSSRCHGSKISGWQQTKNVTWKVNSHSFKIHRSYSISFELSNVGEIFWGLVRKDRI